MASYNKFNDFVEQPELAEASRTIATLHRAGKSKGLKAEAGKFGVEMT